MSSTKEPPFDLAEADQLELKVLLLSANSIRNTAVTNSMADLAKQTGLLASRHARLLVHLNSRRSPLGQRKLDGIIHYGQRSRFTRITMCGQGTETVRYTSDPRRVTCQVCLQMEREGAALFPGGGRYMKAEQ